MKVRNILMFVLVTIALVLSACGGGQAATEAPEPHRQRPRSQPRRRNLLPKSRWSRRLSPLPGPRNPTLSIPSTPICGSRPSCSSCTCAGPGNMMIPIQHIRIWWPKCPRKANGGLSDDGLTITLKLRDNIVWSDGTPITSADFKFTYDTAMADANSVNSQYPYDALTSVEAPDPLTVVMNFSEPFAAWEANFWHGILPAHVLQPVFDADGSIIEAEWNLAPTVGCGPYVLGEWESGSFMRFVKNENYWKGTAKIDEVFLQFVPDDAAQTAALGRR